MRIRHVGAQALLLELDDPTAWFAEVWRRREAGEISVVDIVPGAQSLLLDGVDSIDTVTEQLRTWPAPPTMPSHEGPAVEIPVVYDGEDLAAVANLWSVDERGVVERLNQASFIVAFCGFTPGWAYLSGLPAEWAV